MLVRTIDLSVKSGAVEILSYQYNDRELQRHQCERCGTVLWMNYSDKKDYASIQTGTFDNHDWYQPVAHLWMANAQPWLGLTHQAQRYDTQPELAELITLWANR